MELPKYFVIKRDASNPLWQKYINWLNETYETTLGGEWYNYFGYDGNLKIPSGTNWDDSIANFENNPTLLTLEEWNKAVNGFNYLPSRLPEEYIVKCKNPKEINKVNKYFYGVHYEPESRFSYVICRKKFIIKEGVIRGESFDTVIRPEFKHLIVFTFEEWKYLVVAENPIIVGYLLIKRFPGLDEGTEFTKNKEGKWAFENEESKVYFSDKEISDTEFFEPIYKQNTFSKGDIVTFHSVLYEKNITGKIVELRNDSTCKTDNGFSTATCTLKKATSEEVLNYNIEKFTSSTGITIGSTINEIKTSKRICWSDEKEGWFSVNIVNNREIIGFKMHPDNNTLLLQLTGTTKDIWYDAYKLIKAYPDALDVTINGYKAKFTENSVSFGCQTYSKEFVLTLAEYLRENNFKMDHKDSILKIADYFNSL